ncbi:MAG: DUF1698 domain-containing protein [Cyanobacteria bacterium P01_D01_bin.14]
MKRLLKRLVNDSSQLAPQSSNHPSENASESSPLLPFDGYQANRNAIPGVDNLSDDELQELNQMLDWKAFAVDSHGRRFGNWAGPGKRNKPQIIPNRRILVMDDYFQLADKHVLEAGCFEGFHTIGLCQRAKRVTAFDSRIANVVKTTVRCGLFDCHPTVFRLNIEDCPDYTPCQADVMHHIGVLYHLKDPVTHLLSLGQYIRKGVMLDTHYATAQAAEETYTVKGQAYRFKRHQEKGYADVFSGMYPFARWLLLEDITSLLKQTGFGRIDVIETRQEKNGPRVLLIAQRD